MPYYNGTHDTTARASESFEAADWDTTGGFLTQSNDPASQPWWTRTSGGTPSSNTGPVAAHDGTYYLFTEASSHFNEEFIVNVVTPLTASADYSLELWYHLYGADMGTLSVEMADVGGSTWTTVWTIAGEQQAASADPWAQAVIPITPAADSTLRIFGLTGADFKSDSKFTSSLWSPVISRYVLTYCFCLQWR